MTNVDVRAMGSHRYAVAVTEGEVSTHHTVVVPEKLINMLDVPDLDEERLVQESFVFLLEHEPATSILRQFDLDVISRYFPEYVGEMRGRLA